jgi:hypothetical protein
MVDVNFHVRPRRLSYLRGLIHHANGLVISPHRHPLQLRCAPAQHSGDRFGWVGLLPSGNQSVELFPVRCVVSTLTNIRCGTIALLRGRPQRSPFFRITLSVSGVRCKRFRAIRDLPPLRIDRYACHALHRAHVAFPDVPVRASGTCAVPFAPTRYCIGSRQNVHSASAINCSIGGEHHHAGVLEKQGAHEATRAGVGVVLLVVVAHRRGHAARVGAMAG